MAGRSQEDASLGGDCLLLLIFLFVFFLILILFEEIAILAGFDFVLVVQIIRDDVQMDGVRLRDLELGFALGATQDLAFLDLVFVDVDFGGTFWTTNHGSILRRVLRIMAVTRTVPATLQRIIYRGV